MIDTLPAAKLLQDFGLFIEAIGREEDGDGIADHFLGGVAEHPLGGWIPAFDDAVEVFADDGVVGRGDDRLEAAFQLDVLADVAGNLGGPDDLSMRSWIGEIVTETATGVPSLRRRMVSK